MHHQEAKEWIYQGSPVRRLVISTRANETERRRRFPESVWALAVGVGHDDPVEISGRESTSGSGEGIRGLNDLG